MERGLSGVACVALAGLGVAGLTAGVFGFVGALEIGEMTVGLPFERACSGVD